MKTKIIVPAERIGKVEEYYFSIKLKEIAQMNARGENVLNLGIGSPDLPPSQDTIKALEQCAEESSSHGYQSYNGIASLREGFASFYRDKYSVELDPGCEILPLMGSKEGVMHISMAFLNPGDGVLVPNPGYPTYSSASKLTGADIIYYPLREENGWMPDFEELERDNSSGKIDLSKVKLMWCNYPNMPTGANGSMDLFKKFVAFGHKYGIVICHDNPYSFILNDHPISMLSVPGAKDICIELNSMSKTFNMPGWRIGMAASNKEFISWVMRVKSNMDSGMFKPMQMAAAKALFAPPEWYSKMSDVYSRRRKLAREILCEIGAQAREDQVGMFLWAKAGSDVKELCDKLLYQARVFITPGFIFGSEGEKYLRISLCSNENTLSEALNRIKNIKIK